MELKQQIFKTFGWHFLAKQIVDYTNESFFKIMDTPAIEIAGLAALIHNQTIYNQTNG